MCVWYVAMCTLQSAISDKINEICCFSRFSVFDDKSNISSVVICNLFSAKQ